MNSAFIYKLLAKFSLPIFGEFEAVVTLFVNMWPIALNFVISTNSTFKELRLYSNGILHEEP